MTNYTYADTASPPYKLATANGHWVLAALVRAAGVASSLSSRTAGLRRKN